jgi:hypothetical protein
MHNIVCRAPQVRGGGEEFLNNSQLNSTLCEHFWIDDEDRENNITLFRVVIANFIYLMFGIFASCFRTCVS